MQTVVLETLVCTETAVRPNRALPALRPPCLFGAGGRGVIGWSRDGLAGQLIIRVGDHLKGFR